MYDHEVTTSAAGTPDDRRHGQTGRSQSGGAEDAVAKIRAWILLAAVLASVGLLAGCGADTNRNTSAGTTTVTQEKTVTEQSQPASTPSGSPSTDSSGGSGGSAGGKIEVPDVQGKDHQLAQDTMQAAGLYNLAEEDATGQGRMLIIDRNWTVVEQIPPAGTMVDPDEKITLRSKKDGE
jgi:hypothetical protein